MPVGPNQQAQWRYCGKCRAMFYDGDSKKGRCAAGAGHSAYGFYFTLPHQVVPGANVQDGWRYCGKCRTMFYDGAPANKGACAAV